MKKLLLKLSAVTLLVVCLLSSCTATPPDESPKIEPVEYNCFEVIPAQMIHDVSDEQIVEEGIESIKTTIGRRKVTLFYQYTDVVQRVYKFERDTVSITIGISKITGKVSLLEIIGAVTEIFDDYESIIKALNTENDYLSLINNYAMLFEIEDFHKYEYSCSTCYTTSRGSSFYKDQGFQPLPSGMHQFSHYEFSFKRPPTGGISVDGTTTFEIGPNRFAISICQNPINSELIKLDKAEVIAAVENYIMSNFSRDYSITKIKVGEYGMYIKYVDGRLCCVNIEAIVSYIPKEDDFFDHKHCFYYVFIE